MTTIRILALGSCLVLPVSVEGMSSMQAVYGMLFGGNAVRQEYRLLTHQALADCGVDNPSLVPVRQMNTLGSMITGGGLASFTAAGIWLDQAALDRCSDEERLFQLYHEAAHYWLCHHQKLMAGVVGTSIVSSMLVARIDQSMNWLGALMLNGVQVAGLIAGLVAAVRYQEKQADIKAAQVLIKIGKKEIVEWYIAQLKAASSESESLLWWASIAERIAYLESLMQKGQ